MLYYVRWDGNGETYQEIFDNITDAQRCARATSRVPSTGTVCIINENGTVEETYIYGFLAE